MTSTVAWIAGLMLVPAAVLVFWTWSAMAQVDKKVRSIIRFEGMDFEIGPDDADDARGAR